MSGIEIAGHRVPGWAPVAALGVAGGLLLLRARAAGGSNPLAGAGLTAADLAGGVGPPLPGLVSPTTDAGTGGAAAPTGTAVFGDAPAPAVTLTGGAGGVGLLGKPYLPPTLIGPGPSPAG